MRLLYGILRRPNFDPRRSWAAAVAIAILAVLILRARTHSWPVITVAAWDAAAIPLIVLPWRLILSSDCKATEQRAAEEDPGRKALVVIPVLSSVVALIAAAGLIGQSGKPPWLHLWHSLPLGVFAVGSAWALVHTTFAQHYARLYYPGGGEPGGLDFPGLRNTEEKPDNLDFAYFSFMIGTAFQGSDVEVSSRSIRRVVLAHAVLSFVFNTVILALAINVVFDMLRQ